MLLRWFLLLSVSLSPSLSALESLYASSTSLTNRNDTRAFALMCHLDPDNCNCSMGPVGPPPPTISGACRWDAITCQCGRDYQDTGTFEHLPGLPIPAGQICVVDTDKCQCMAGSPPLTPALSSDAKLQKLKSELLAVKAKLELLLNSGKQADQPILALARLILLITRLGDVVTNSTKFAKLDADEREALVAFLRDETEYIGKLRIDPAFMAAQLDKVEAGTMQPIVVRLRSMIARLEKASLSEEPE